MVKRYVPRSPFVVRDKGGLMRVFNPDRKRPDGTLGYTEEEIKSLPARFRKEFDVQEVSGSKVEQATAAPGEMRSVAKPEDE